MRRRSVEQPTAIDFMRYGRYAIRVSGLLMVLALGLVLFKGLNLGLDFTGGTMVEVRYPHSADLTQVRHTLNQSGLGSFQVLHYGSSQDVLIRLGPQSQDLSAQVGDRVLRVLQQQDPQVALRRVEFVGPQVGHGLFAEGALALFYALAAILAYVAFRFEWRLSVGTVVALFHDVILTLGALSLFGVEFNLTALAAILAIVGYSVNDTVVILDRIRENFRKIRKTPVVEIINISINETLSRTLTTSFTTALAVCALLLFGGPILRQFSITLLIGILVGVYSSVYVAAQLALEFGLSRQDLLPKAREELDSAP